STQALEPMVELGRTRLEMVLKVLDVDGAVRRVKGGWLGTGEPWHYDRERYERLDEARLSEQRAMIEYQTTSECRMAFLRRQLDDPSLTGDEAADRCGRCDNCTGEHLSAEVSETDVESTRQRLDRPGLTLSARKQWPSGLKKVGVELSGKISDGPEEGRILGRLTDPVWGPRLRALTDGDDGPAPDGLEAACIKVLAEWTWSERPTGLMVMESDTRPTLLNDLCERLARVGRLTPLGTLRRRPDARPASGANSAFRVASLVDAYDPPDLSAHAGPILLLDLSTDTGWTLTMAARALRAAGADAVLPFALIGRG
ncbi:MAG: RecQ family zinc-binding domain-containing protein, partial [Rhodococcus sp. (in: high G+C Gram-positive bacteria)]